MEFQSIVDRAITVRELYSKFEEQNYGKQWTNEEIALGFVGDVGDLVKLILAANGHRKISDGKQRLEHELADCLWSILVLAKTHGIDLEKAFLETMDNLERHLSE